MHYGIDIVTSGTDPIPSSSLSTDWGTVPADNHVYTINFAGTGSVLTLKYFDDWYADNTQYSADPLRVDIFAPVAVAANHLTATPDAAAQTVTLAWDAQAAGTAQFVVQRSADGGDFQSLATVPSGTNSYVDQSPPKGHIYAYRILTEDPDNPTVSSADTAYSNTATVFLIGKPPLMRIPSAIEWVGTSLDYQLLDAHGQINGNYTYSVTTPDTLSLTGLTVGNTGDPPGIQPGEIRATINPQWPDGIAKWPFVARIGILVTDPVTGASTPAILEVLDFPSHAGDPQISAGYPTATVVPTSDPQSGPTQISLTVQATDDGGEPNLTYTWEAISYTDPSSAVDDVPDVSFSDNGTNSAKNSVAEVSRAGTYTFKVTVADQNGQLAWSTVTQTISPQLVQLSIDPHDIQLAPGMVQALTAVGLDQFLQPMQLQSQSEQWDIVEADPSHPTYVDNSISIDASGNVEAATTTNNIVSPATIGGSYTVHVRGTDGAGHSKDATTSVQIRMDAVAALSAHAVAANVNGTWTVTLDARWAGGTQRVDTGYHWTLTDSATPPHTVYDSGAGGAQEVSVPLGPGTYNVDLEATETLPNNGGIYDFHDITSVTVPNPRARIDVSASVNSIPITADPITIVKGNPLVLTAQEFSASGQQNTSATFDWSAPAGSFTNPSGGTITYTAPPTATDGTVRITVTDHADPTISYSFPIQLVDSAPAPIVRIVSIGDGAQSGLVGVGKNESGIAVGEDGITTPSLLPQDGGAQQISVDTPVYGVVTGGSGDPVTWTLTATPLNVPSSGTAAPITIATGAGDVSDGSDEGDVLGIIKPGVLANGLYTLTLTATNSFDTSTGPIVVSTSRTISVFSSAGLGNLTLPFTDLTVPNPNGPVVTISRTYDSSLANQNNGDFGRGWQFGGYNASLRTTIHPDPQDQGLHGFHDGDLVYVTLPGGQKHTFEFVAKVISDDPGNTLLGFVADAVHYHPQFVAVDGSNATLVDDTDSAHPNGAELVEDGGLYKVYLTHDAYNPANTSGGVYKLTEQDGTSYTISAAGSTAGQITSIVDANQNTTTYASGGITIGSTSPTQLITIQRDSSQRIEWVGATAAVNNNVPNSKIGYAYDQNTNELIGVTDRNSQRTTYLYEDALVLAGTSQQTAYAVLVDQSGHYWNPTAGPSNDPTNRGAFESYNVSHYAAYAIPLASVTDPVSATVQWYAGALPSQWSDPTARPVLSNGAQFSVKYLLEPVNASGPATTDTLLSTEPRTWYGAAAAHDMIGIIDPHGVRSLTAAYNPDGQLSALTNATGQSAPINTADYQGSSADQTVTDLATNQTTNQYDSHGNLTRSIQAVTDSSGNVVKWVVTLHAYDYASDDDAGAHLVGYGYTNEGRLAAETDYLPFEISAPDVAGNRFQFVPAQPSRVVTYNLWSINADPKGLFLPASETDYTADGTTRTTLFSNYDALGHPGTVQTPDGTTSNDYDSHGNLLSTTNAVGEVTNFWYTNGTGGIPAGLEIAAYQIRKDSNGNPLYVVLSSNTYYGSGTYDMSDDPTYDPATQTHHLPNPLTIGGTAAEQGRLATSTDAYNVATNYTYNADGTPDATYHLWTNPASPSTQEWVWSENHYEGGLLKWVDSGLYSYSSTGSINDPSRLLGQSDNPAAQHLLKRAFTHYNTAGQLDYTETQYLNASGQTIETFDHTENHYDIQGNLVETVYSDNTAVRNVYDAMGRIVWTTDRFSLSPSGLPSGTETLYDSLGRSYQTRRYRNVNIVVTPDTGVAGAYDVSFTPPSEDNFVSSTTTGYNQNGEASSQTDAAGLTTLTTYYPNGQVEITQPLTSPATAPATYYYDQGQFAALTPTGTILSNDTFTISLASGDGIVHQTLTITVPSQSSQAQACAQIASIFNSTAASPDSNHSLFLGFMAVVQTVSGVSSVRLVADPTHQPVTIGGSATGGPTFPVTSSGYTDVRLVDLDTSGPIAASDQFTITLKSADGQTTVPVIVAANSADATVVSHQMVTNINAVGQPLGVWATDLKGHVRLFIGSAADDEVGSEPPFATVTASVSSTTTKIYANALHIASVQDALGNISSTETDPLGRTIRVVNADGTFSQTLYGVSQQPVPGHAVSGQSIDGYQKTVIDAQGNATDYFYDRGGRLTDVYQPAPDASSSRPRWSYGYDIYGNQTSTTDPRSGVTSSQWNPTGRTIVTSFTYDAMGRETSRTLPDGQTGMSLAGLQTEQWTYDELGRQLTYKDFLGTSETDSYYSATDPHAGMLQQASYVLTGRPTESVWYTYDSLGRKYQVSDSTEGATTYGYDADGNTTSITSPQGTIHYEYDPATGRQVRMWTGTDSSNAANDTAYGYDAQGRLQNVWALVLNNVRYGTYTGLNAASHQPTFTGSPLTITYGYDADGNLTSDAQPNGITTSYTYDHLNRMTDLSASNTISHHLVFTQHFDLRSDGLKSDVVETRYNSDGSVFSTAKITWAYDNLGRLKTETYDAGNNGMGTSGDYIDTFSYDPAGNRLNKVHDDGGDGIHTSTDITTTYQYGTVDANGNLLVVNGDDWLLYQKDLTGGSSPTTTTTTYSYNYNGSQIATYLNGSLTPQSTYTWDLRNRMASATANGSTTTYAYDSDGVRIAEIGSTTTYFLNDPANPTGYAKAIEEKSSPTNLPTRSYVFGLAVEGQGDTASGTLFLLDDAHGSTRVLIDLNQNVMEKYDYTAFGDLLTNSGSQANASAAKTRWLFAGDGVYDPATGWTYQLARWRDGFSFTSIDPSTGDLDSPASLNPYAYAAENPLDFADPTGLYFSMIELTSTLSWAADYYITGINSVSVWTGISVTPSPLNPFQNPPPLALTFVPIFGSLLSAAYNANHGNWGQAALDVGFAALDVAGFEFISRALSGPALRAIFRSGDLLKVMASERTVQLFRRIAESSGFRILTNQTVNGLNVEAKTIRFTASSLRKVPLIQLLDEWGHLERILKGVKTVGGQIINRTNILHHIEIFTGWAEDARLLPFERDTAKKAVDLLKEMLKQWEKE